MDEELKDIYTLYEQLGHAIQTGIAFLMEHDPTFVAPKHLRTGLDMRAADHGALVALLIDKGVFTEKEYAMKLVEFAQREVYLYQGHIKKKLGVDVVLQ